MLTLKITRTASNMVEIRTFLNLIYCILFFPCISLLTIFSVSLTLAGNL